jgi:hypothetical protein
MGEQKQKKTLTMLIGWLVRVAAEAAVTALVAYAISLCLG